MDTLAASGRSKQVLNAPSLFNTADIASLMTMALESTALTTLAAVV
jgi:hypothetical protein